MQPNKKKNKYLRTLLAYALSSASLFQMALPVFAQTAAGQTIRNTATATYDNPDDPNSPFTTESNTVTITVAKVAGITNVPAGSNNLGDLNNAGNGAGGTVLTNHTVELLFDVTNTGNDVANIFIPSRDQLTTTGLNTGSLVVEVDADGDGTFETTVPDTGGQTITNVAANSTIQVRVTGVVTATSAGAPISVQLGDTGSNTAPNSPAADTQNQADLDDGAAQINDVRTQNSNTATVSGDPANGQREASATNQIFLGSNPKALAIIRKTNSGVTNDNGTPSVLNDDLITFNLDLEVANSSPNPLFTPGALDGRDYSGADPNLGTVTGVTDNSNLILVSDAIPSGTSFTPGTNTISSPAGGAWTPVYTDVSTTTPADQANWNTNPAALGTITRIGWVYEVNTSGLIDPGDTVSGFSFTVTTTGLDATNGGTVANIAQVFGTTDPDGVDDTTSEGDDVYDESGDSNPDNLNDDGSVGPDEDDPESDGVGDPANHGTDGNNDNTGSGPGGEDNVITLNPPGNILNGPGGQADASGNVFGVGPDNNHDFQNRAIAPDVVDGTSDPAPVQFTNTLSNPGTAVLTDVLLQPIQPSVLGGNDADIPNGTTVTIDFGNQSATYTYNNGTFTISSGSPILIPSLNPNVAVNYTVTVDLPVVGNSTDEIDTDSSDFNSDLIGGFPISIVAYQDSDADGTPFVAGDVNNPEVNSNYTVDQIYKGFLKLIKQVRVLDSQGNQLQPFTAFPTSPDYDAQPGQILEYRIIYRNISDPQAGSGTNVVLDANNVIITEDGELDLSDDNNLNESANNWALDNNNDGNIDTLNVQNTAQDSSVGSTINYLTTGAVDNGTIDTGDDVTGYRVTIPTLSPAGIEASTAFETVDSGDEAATFQREVNSNPPSN